jgi:hypothetical protein
LLRENTGIIGDDLVAEWPEGVVQLDVAGVRAEWIEAGCARHGGAAEGQVPEKLPPIEPAPVMQETGACCSVAHQTVSSTVDQTCARDRGDPPLRTQVLRGVQDVPVSCFTHGKRVGEVYHVWWL